MIKAEDFKARGLGVSTSKSRVQEIIKYVDECINAERLASPQIHVCATRSGWSTSDIEAAAASYRDNGWIVTTWPESCAGQIMMILSLPIP